MKTHKNTLCQFCNQEFSKANIARHKKNKHGVIIQKDSANQMTCPTCQCVLSKKSWSKHFEKFHSEKKKIKDNQVFESSNSNDQILKIFNQPITKMKPKQILQHYPMSSYSLENKIYETKDPQSIKRVHKKINPYFNYPVKIKRIQKINILKKNDIRNLERLNSIVGNYYHSRPIQNQIKFLTQHISQQKWFYLFMMGMFNTTGVYVNEELLGYTVTKQLINQSYSQYQRRISSSYRHFTWGINPLARGLIQLLQGHQLTKYVEGSHRGYILNDYGMHLFFCIKYYISISSVIERWQTLFMRYFGDYWKKRRFAFDIQDLFKLKQCEIMKKFAILWLSSHRDQYYLNISNIEEYLGQEKQELIQMMPYKRKQEEKMKRQLQLDQLQDFRDQMKMVKKRPRLRRALMQVAELQLEPQLNPFLLISPQKKMKMQQLELETIYQENQQQSNLHIQADVVEIKLSQLVILDPVHVEAKIDHTEDLANQVDLVEDLVDLAKDDIENESSGSQIVNQPFYLGRTYIGTFFEKKRVVKAEQKFKEWIQRCQNQIKKRVLRSKKLRQRLKRTITQIQPEFLSQLK